MDAVFLLAKAYQQRLGAGQLCKARHDGNRAAFPAQNGRVRCQRIQYVPRAGKDRGLWIKAEPGSTDSGFGDDQFQAVRHTPAQVLHYSVQRGLGVLPGHEPTGDLGHCLCRNNRLYAGTAVAGTDSVDFQGRPESQPLGNSVLFLSAYRRHSGFRFVAPRVKRHGIGQLLLFGCQFRDRVIEARHGNRSVFTMQTGDNYRQRVGGIGRHAAMRSGMQVVCWTPHGERQVHYAAQTHGNGRCAGWMHCRVAHHENIRRNALAPIFDRAVETAAATFFFSFEDHPDVHLEGIGTYQRVDGLQDIHQLALVVLRPARIQARPANRRRKRGRRPLRQWICRLDIVMPVEENSGGVRACGSLRVDERMRGRLHQLRLESCRLKVISKPRSTVADVLCVPGISANAGKTQHGLPFRQEPVPAFLEEPFQLLLVHTVSLHGMLRSPAEPGKGKGEGTDPESRVRAAYGLRFVLAETWQIWHLLSVGDRA